MPLQRLSSLTLVALAMPVLSAYGPIFGHAEGPLLKGKPVITPLPRSGLLVRLGGRWLLHPVEEEDSVPPSKAAV